MTTSRACELTLTALVSTAGVPGRVERRIVALDSPDGELADGLLRFEPVGGISSSGRGTVDRRDPSAEAGGARAGRLVGQRRPGNVLPDRRASWPHLPVAADRGHGAELDALDGRPPRRPAAEVGHRPRVRRAAAAQRGAVGRAVAGTAGAARRRSGRGRPAPTRPSSTCNRRSTASSPASTSIFGLAQWKNYHYYYGHVMWDIEAFAVPPLLLTQPEAAAAMLAFRRRTLVAAEAERPAARTPRRAVSVGGRTDGTVRSRRRWAR